MRYEFSAPVASTFSGKSSAESRLQKVVHEDEALGFGTDKVDGAIIELARDWPTTIEGFCM